MPLAYHILAHKNPEQVARLLAAIWTPTGCFVIHYDRRCPAHEHRRIAALAAGRPNVIIQAPTAVLWGRFSLIRAQLAGLGLALRHPQPWTHWINLSGQCFPLHPAAEIEARLAAAGPTSFMRHFDPLGPDSNWPDAAWRLERRHLDSPTLEWWIRLPGLGRRLRSWLGGPRDIPSLPRLRPRPRPWFRWYGGDNWVVLARAAAEHLTTPAAHAIIAWFHTTAFPEESIFQTVLLNGPGAGPVRNDHLRRVNWCGGRGSPQIFRISDLADLHAAAARGCLFARKFDPAADPAILDALAARLVTTRE